MISFDLLQFDQTNILFLVVSAIGLIRERRLLPFFIVLLGNAVHGALPAVFLAGLILWHRIDNNSSRWIQLKDALGFLFILIAAVTAEPFHEFSAFMGVFALSFSFGRGSLGVIPPLLLLRQYFPAPTPIEVILGSAGVYWLTVEALKWSKAKAELLVSSIIETLCTIGILYGLRDYAIRFVEDPSLIALGSSLAVVSLMIGVWASWKPEAFVAFFQRAKSSTAKTLFIGNRLVSAQNPFSSEPATRSAQGIDESFNRLFFLSILAIVLLGAFCLMSRGGFN